MSVLCVCLCVLCALCVSRECVSRLYVPVGALCALCALCVHCVLCVVCIYICVYTVCMCICVLMFMCMPQELSAPTSANPEIWYLFIEPWTKVS